MSEEIRSLKKTDKGPDAEVYNVQYRTNSYLFCSFVIKPVQK